MDILVLLSAVSLCLAGAAGAIKQMHMMQQNSYYLSRYFKWLASQSDFGFYARTALGVIIALLFMVKWYAFAFIISLLFAAFCLCKNIKEQKKAIKPLVFTQRIIRTFSVAVALLFIGVLLFALVQNGIIKIVALTLCFVLGIFPELLTAASFIIMKPVEKAITNGFINDAKKILASNKNLKVIGVTGSYGKTSVKFILARILSEKFNVLATPQSFNTPMGVVRTIREKLRPQTEIFVCEMGAKNVGDIKEICHIVHPDLGLITSVGEQHLETFKTLENVCSTKFELYHAVKQKGGKVFANVNSAPIYERQECGADIIGYGTKENAFARAENISYSAQGAEFDVTLSGETIHLKTKLLGAHNVINITGAAALAKELGVKGEDIAYAVSRLEQTQHRLELKPFKNGSVMIDDAYNSNPEGCLEAVNVLSRFENSFKVIITPGLVELGDREYDVNYSLGVHAAKAADVIITVGKKRSEPIVKGALDNGFKKENLFVAESFKNALEIFEPFAKSGTVLLVENDLPDNYLK